MLERRVLALQDIDHFAGGLDREANAIRRSLLRKAIASSASITEVAELGDFPVRAAVCGRGVAFSAIETTQWRASRGIGAVRQRSRWVEIRARHRDRILT